MADTIEGIVQEQRARLLSDIMKSDLQYFTETASNDTKERMIKEGILNRLNALIVALNNEFEDVHFQYNWVQPHAYKNTKEGHSCSRDVFNRDFLDDIDEDEWGTMYDERYTDHQFFDKPLNEIDIQFTYFWERTCNLGCKHRTRRFYITNFVKLLDILTLYSLNAPIRSIVEIYIPDFFMMLVRHL